MGFSEWAQSLDEKAFPRKADAAPGRPSWRHIVLFGFAILVVLLFVPPIVALPVSVAVVSFYVWRAFRPTKGKNP